MSGRPISCPVAAPPGFRGWAPGLREAGIAVHESDQPTLASHGLTVVVEPYGVSHDEADSWMRSLRNGATLVYASDTPDPFTRALGIRYEPGGTVANLARGDATLPARDATRLGRALGDRARCRPDSVCHRVVELPSR